MAKDIEWRPPESMRFHGWHFREWKSSEFVQGLTLEAKGAYIDLLTSQMACGSIPADLQKMRTLFGANGPSLQDLEDRIWPQISSKWEPFSEYWDDEKKCAVRVDPPDPSRLQNAALTRYMIEDHEIWEKKRARGIRAAEGRWSRKDEIETALAKKAEEEPVRDLTAVLKRYPHRPEGPGGPGWSEGVMMLQLEVANDDAEAALEAAVDAYAAKMRGRSKYVKQLRNWAAEWMDYIPRGFVPPSKRAGYRARPVDPTNVIQLHPAEPEKAGRERPEMGWPWEQLMSGPPLSKARAVACWTDELREKYKAGEDVGPLPSPGDEELRKIYAEWSNR